MNTPDLYGAWLTAGNRLQPVGAWIGGHWMWLVPAVAAAVFAVWSIRRSLRQASKKVDRILAEELGQRATDNHTREEKP